MELCIGSWRPQYLQEALVPAAFQRQAAMTPDSPCLLAEDGSFLTFAQTDAAATALARRLAARGVGKDVAVGILLDRSPAVVVSMIAVHKAGGCYVPLDPSFPADRLSIYLEDSQSLALITEPKNQGLADTLIAELPHRPYVLLYKDAEDAASTELVLLPDLSLQSPADLAYIMFTSGSTGRPKGVMVTHGGVRDLVAFNVERFGLGPQDVFCLNSTVGFDSYVTYVFASLVLGARLVVPGPTAHLDPTGMACLIATHGITTMECVPALASEYLYAFKEAGSRLSCLTRFLTGGEALTPKLAEEIVATLPGLQKGGLFNSYGPTEVTVTTITGHVTAPFDHITMGLPDHNVHTYVVILDEGADPSTARLAAVGEPGELWLSGPRLARGYRNRPDLTAKAFVPNPFFEAATASLPADAEVLRPHYRLAYRTGDLVVMSSSGTIDFLGRVDRQVKVNGVRMEVGEIENVLAAAPGVTHAAVKPWKDPQGAYRLAGYVAPGGVDLAATDAFLRSKLLPAMVPSQLVALEQMPRLPNGKIDVKSLEEPSWGPAAAAADAAGADGAAGAAAAAAETPLELLMAEAWAEVLHLPLGQVDVNANFFQLGGSSLRAGLINSRVRRATEFDISGMLIYQHPTIRGMAAAVERTFGSYPPNSSSASNSSSSSSSNIGAMYPGGSSDDSSCTGSTTDVAITVDDGSSSKQALPAAGAAAAGGQVIGRALPLWMATMLQFLGPSLIGIFLYAIALPTSMVLYYLFGYLEAPEWVIALAAPLFAVYALVCGSAFAIVSKWVLLGRVQPGVRPVWSWFHIRWLIVRMIVKTTLAGIFPLVRATPLLNWFYIALGAKIGRNVMIDTVSISDWDMLEIGDDVAIEADSFVVGSHIQAGKAAGDYGTLNTARTVIGSGCTIMAQSVVSAGTSLAPGTILTPGSCSARPPAGPSDAAAHEEVRTEPKRLPAPLWLGSSIILVLVFSFMWLAVVPSIALWYWLNLEDADTWQDLLGAALDCFLTTYDDGIGLCRELWWSGAVSMLLVPPTAMALSIFYMWAMVPIKWLLVGRITQKKTENAGTWWHFRTHLWRSLVRGPFVSATYLWTSTEMYNMWLRAMGAKIGRQCWLSEQFSCSEFELYEVGDTASVCSFVSVVGCTNAHTRKIKLGEACDVTNECTLLPGCEVGKGAVLGVFTYGRPGQKFEDYSITLGDFTLRSGMASAPAADEEAGAGAKGAEQLESAATRLLPTWQYVLYHLLYIPGAFFIFTLTTAFVLLPVPLLGLSMIYNFGWWVSILASFMYGPVGFCIFLAYLAVMKRAVFWHMAGEYPIFRSFKVGRWQMLALNAHIYDDMGPVMGTVFYNMYLRAMGSKVGAGVCCMGAVVAEYEQVQIGEGSVLNEASFLLTHTVENRCAKIRPISIGKRVTVGTLAAVLPDASMADGATLADVSLVMKGETVPKNGTWAGVPACAVPKGSLFPALR